MEIKPKYTPEFHFPVMLR